MKPSNDKTPPTSKKLLPDKKKAKEVVKIKPKKKRKLPRKKPGIQKQKIKISKPKENQEETIEIELTEKQKEFCKEYILSGWNGLQSYKKVYKCAPNTAMVNASKLLRNTNIQAYIVEIRKDIEKLTGITKEKVLSEVQKLAFSSIAHLHNTWIERKDFDLLSDDQKSSISEIDTKILKKNIGTSDEPEIVDVEFIKIRLHDKAKAIDILNKMMGYNAPEKIAKTDPDGNAVEEDIIAVKIIHVNAEKD
jgi:hypothetical protein